MQLDYSHLQMMQSALEATYLVRVNFKVQMHAVVMFGYLNVCYLGVNARLKVTLKSAYWNNQL